MRLNRYLAAAGQGSRRSCDELIRSGQVSINGVVCTTLATHVDPTDVVKVRNRVMQVARPITLLLHKPPGFLCTASDTHSRRTIFDLLPPNYPRLFHVGRLDMESEGLLLVTNDGDLSLKLTHPRYKIDKEYEVVLDKTFDFELSEKLLKGIPLEEGRAKAESVHRIANNKVKLVLRQGMKRQIRLMFHALGYDVIKLIRTRIGPIEILNMPPGAWRELTQKEIDSLLNSRQASTPTPLKKGAETAKKYRQSLPASERFPKRRAASDEKGEQSIPARRDRDEWPEEESLSEKGGKGREGREKRGALKSRASRGEKPSRGTAGGPRGARSGGAKGSARGEEKRPVKRGRNSAAASEKAAYKPRAPKPAPEAFKIFQKGSRRRND